jgi:hypothetical protein
MPLSSSRSEVCSSMIPIEALTCLRRAMSSQDITPGLRWGRRPVSSMIRMQTARRYSSVLR